MKKSKFDPTIAKARMPLCTLCLYCGGGNGGWIFAAALLWLV